ncbi:site-2 protease family protein [Deinococcus soli (ex Cha et al. 2016)]|uniref:Regulator of sigma E protease n=2 Tax=Deinococcus soli (ex Cha et al. 2016) TaxID=1309411 RepID=A0AAE3XBF2_9DEIO|nr:site-2 protease family protein [Deinococcus soli (ex Cha et al. 2016)]MDR6218397.1 regulator of sigma E protease [Deinococcus soli (ex Cha et al. 2016)]MDR6329137.1 regulator of sigma E protease [Deinococcus soli (ex Cha et al. 2016)]MDR6751410.1 regulator of sigma E protease [Deinococcus soli (ex Cha et al. 2016)]
MSIVAFVVMLLTAVGIHELGHLLAARALGVRVPIFSIGLGRALWARTYRGTEWRLSLLPLGGYVKIDGMEAEELEDGSYQRAAHGYDALRTPGRLAILLAGPLANILLALILLTAGFSWQQMHTRTLHVQTSQLATLRAGDVIVGVNDMTLDEVTAARLNTQVTAAPLRLNVRRAGGLITVPVARGPALPFTFETRASGGPAALGPSLRRALDLTASALPATLDGMKKLAGAATHLDAANLSDTGVSGPIGSARLIGDLGTNPAMLVLLAGTLNLSLAYFNLLPIPGLDGGRAAVHLTEAVIRRRLSPAVEHRVTLAGIALLLVIIVFVTLGDLLSLRG